MARRMLELQDLGQGMNWVALLTNRCFFWDAGLCK